MYIELVAPIARYDTERRGNRGGGATSSRARHGKDKAGRQERGVAKERNRRNRASDSEEGELPPNLGNKDLGREVSVWQLEQMLSKDC